MIFRDRLQAARFLEDKLSKFRGVNPVVLGVPRGAVPMARVIADGLGAELDLVLVHKLPHPEQPELAIGAVSEEGEVSLSEDIERFGVSEDEVAETARQEVAKLQAKRRLYTPHRRAIDVKGRTVILVDDGIATGSTMLAAVRTMKDKGADRVVVATPVASDHAVSLIEREGAEVVVLDVPPFFYAVSQFYEDFDQVEDAEVVQVLSGARPEVKIVFGDFETTAFLSVPASARGLVIFAHGSGSGRHSSRNQFVARELQKSGFATLLGDLLSEEESRDRRNVFSIDLLARRVRGFIDWAKQDPQLARFPIGLFGASTGAAAALVAARDRAGRVQAIVSRGGRVDMADTVLQDIRIPTLFIVGSDDEPVVSWNYSSLRLLSGPKDIAVVEGASHLFEEPGALEQVAELSGRWFGKYLKIEEARAHFEGGRA